MINFILVNILRRQLSGESIFSNFMYEFSVYIGSLSLSKKNLTCVFDTHLVTSGIYEISCQDCDLKYK